MENLDDLYTVTLLHGETLCYSADRFWVRGLSHPFMLKELTHITPDISSGTVRIDVDNWPVYTFKGLNVTDVRTVCKFFDDVAFLPAWTGCARPKNSATRT